MSVKIKVIFSDSTETEVTLSKTLTFQLEMYGYNGLSTVRITNLDLLSENLLESLLNNNTENIDRISKIELYSGETKVREYGNLSNPAYRIFFDIDGIIKEMISMDFI
jgi:hypothetical protein